MDEKLFNDLLNRVRGSTGNQEQATEEKVRRLTEDIQRILDVKDSSLTSKEGLLEKLTSEEGLPKLEDFSFFSMAMLYMSLMPTLSLPGQVVSIDGGQWTIIKVLATVGFEELFKVFKEKLSALTPSQIEEMARKGG